MVLITASNMDATTEALESLRLCDQF